VTDQAFDKPEPRRRSPAHLRSASAPGRVSWSDRIARLASEAALRDSLAATALCLALSAISGIGAVLIFGDKQPGPGDFNPPGLASGLGPIRDVLVAPFVRWDAVWYLWTALHGYGPGGSPPGQFFPLYPLLVAMVARVGIGVVLAGLLISVASTAVALRFLWKLTDYLFGARCPEAARLAVYATALFPMGFFLTADYPQSLLLACSVGAVWMTCRNRWGWAGALGGLAAAADSLGFLVIVPLGLLYLRAHHWRPRLNVLWLLLVPAGYGAFMTWLALKGFDPFSPFFAHKEWLRVSMSPISGLWLAIRAAGAGVQQIWSGQNHTFYWTPAQFYGYDPMTIARDNVEQFLFLLVAVVGAIVALRRLPLAYGAYVVAILGVVVSDPIRALPLDGLSRFIAVGFPITMVLGFWLGRHRRWRLPVLGGSALAMVYFAGSFATWHWVA
jgi:hypothetical protein